MKTTIREPWRPRFEAAMQAACEALRPPPDPGSPAIDGTIDEVLELLGSLRRRRERKGSGSA